MPLIPSLSEGSFIVSKPSGHEKFPTLWAMQYLIRRCQVQGEPDLDNTEHTPLDKANTRKNRSGPRVTVGFTSSQIETEYTRLLIQVRG
jgi:hypothetical protein